MIRSILIVAVLTVSAPAMADTAADEAVMAGPDLTLPNPVKTPGDWFTRDAAVICSSNFRTSKIRNVPGSLKNAVYTDYGLKSHRDGQCNSEEGCEIDHLVSLELGGSNEQKNLWPQSFEGDWNAHDKDALENELHKRVCAGRMSLIEAQDGIRTNWKALYVRVFKRSPYGADAQ